MHDIKNALEFRIDTIYTSSRLPGIQKEKKKKKENGGSLLSAARLLVLL